MTHAVPRRRADLQVGIVPIQGCTLLALSGFLDTLRLAADDGDRSRPIRCRWTVMAEGRSAIRASCGLVVQPASDLLDPAGFDYLAVVGGTLHEGPRETPGLPAYLRRAAALGVPLIGLCTGSFTLARAGLMANRTACVSWFHHHDYAAEFPDHAVVSDRLFLDDGNRITCAGGVSVIHLASRLVERHCGESASRKGLRIMIEEAGRPGAAPQPMPEAAPGRPLPPSADPRVRRVVLMMERRLAHKLSLADLARVAGVTPRHLTRLFRADFAMTPAETLLSLRLSEATRRIAAGHSLLADIAAECGFADASHLVRRYRAATGTTPRGRAADGQRR